jgi:hypothetical protein
MFNIFSLKKKEVSEELQRTEKVFDAIKEPVENSDPNKFLLAEKNSIPYFIYITSNNIINANNLHICFIDLEETLKLIPRSLEFSEKVEDRNLTNQIKKRISDFLRFGKVRDFFKFESEEGIKDINKLDDKTKKELLKFPKEINTIKINSIGKILASINRYGALMLTNIENKSKRFKNLIFYLNSSH